MSTTTRRELLNKIYNEFLYEIEPLVKDISKLKSLGLNADWLETLIWLNQINIENLQMMITFYDLQNEIIPCKYPQALETFKKFILKVKSL